MRLVLAAFTIAFATVSTVPAADPAPLRVLFLGDNGHHVPAERFRQLEPVLARRGIELTYTDSADSLNPKTLDRYDVLLIYANTTPITPDQERALLGFVEGGKGLVALHCASYCFLNSPKYTALVGAQFQKHGTGVVRTNRTPADHAVMKGFDGFTSWDETYVHTKHNTTDRTVLEVRPEGDAKEPWTWVRTQGKGRVFYTAWGHDQRTWSNPGFQELVERGVRWAAGQDPTIVTRPADTRSPFDEAFPVPRPTAKRTDVQPFEYDEVGKKIPNYTPGGAWGTQGEPFTKMQRPLPAEESVKHLILPAGFRAEVFVTEKELGGKPICMTWDERGRLWAALTMDYPNELQRPGQGRDRIVVCEDTDGEGRADKVTTFADVLSIPTGIAFARGGVIVFEGGRTLFLKDSKGTGRADVREVLFGTWNMRDTHGGPSNLQYGLDNWLWAMQGYNDSRLTVGGEEHRFRQGFFRFKPDGSKLEFLRSTNNNTWGLGLSEEGIVFGSTANGNPSEFMPIPNRYYEAVRGWAPSLMLNGIAGSPPFLPVTDRVRQVDFHGHFTAAAGHSLYTARAYPKEYWDRTAFVAEPTGHLVATFVLRRDGSGFRSDSPCNLVASDDEWTAPIMAEVGPDGNVWVLDWYNFIVQHNPTPQGFRTGKGAAYESDLRDKTHGRIYRIVYEGGPKKPAITSLAGATPAQLIAALKDDNLFWRRHAQRLLVERGDRDVLSALYALVRDRSVDTIGLNPGVIHALWTIHGLGALDGANAEAAAVAVSALRHPSAGVRRNAVQVLPRTSESVAAVLAADLTRDPDPQVRLMTILALADLPPDERAAPAILDALVRDAGDRWIPDAATAAAARNAAAFLRSLVTVQRPAPKVLDVITVVAEHFARGNPTIAVGGIIGRLGDAEPAAADAAVRGLARGWPAKLRPTLDERAEADLLRLANRLAPERRGALVRLAAGWGSQSIAKLGAETAKVLLGRVGDTNASAATRVAAAEELLGYQPADTAAVKTLLDQVTPQSAPDLADGLLRALRASESPEAATLILDRLPTLTPNARSAGVGVLLTRPEWTRKLLDAIDRGRLSLADLTLDQKQALASHPNGAVRRAALATLNRGGALPNADRQKVIDEYAAAAGGKGDVAAGKKVFTAQCAKCHRHSGEGQNIGPDLTGMAVHPKASLLIDILDPSRSVEGNFRVYRVSLTDGRVLQGLLAAESKTAVELVDTDAKRHTILRANIDELAGSNKSLMPDGFEKQVSVKDMTDLLEFLTHKGKFFPVPLDKVATAVSTRSMFYGQGNPAERLVLADWKPRVVEGVPFVLTDPQAGRANNVVLFYGPNGALPPKMPKAVALPCNSPVKTIHILGGVSGWGFPYSDDKSVSLIVRLHYAGGATEDHDLVNGVHVADYIRRVDVPRSKFAFAAEGGQQVRYLAVVPKQNATIERLELVKGPDRTAPVVLAVTLELPD
jgi:putative membrane-bound dehydrogenase-like protein